MSEHTCEICGIADVSVISWQSIWQHASGFGCIEALKKKLAEFNTEWQHDPPQDDDTKWIKVQWCKWLNDAQRKELTAKEIDRLRAENEGLRRTANRALDMI